jgi:hypothetical protein
MPEAQKLTLALDVCFSKVPMLPEKLLKEVLPGVGSALFKKKDVKKKKINFVKKGRKRILCPSRIKR